MTGALRLEPWAGESARLVADHGAVATQAIALLTEIPRPPPWACYLAHAGDAVVGIGAFKGAPDAEGTVEIAYLTFPIYERQGHATATVAALVGIARRGGAATVIAHTLPTMNASGRALRRNGFVQADAFDDPEDGPVWYWECLLDPA